MSPYSYNNTIYEWVLNWQGDLESFYASNNLGVFPVVFLTSDISLEGSGTASDPYIIK